MRIYQNLKDWRTDRPLKRTNIQPQRERKKSSERHRKRSEFDSQDKGQFDFVFDSKNIEIAKGASLMSRNRVRGAVEESKLWPSKNNLIGCLL